MSQLYIHTCIVQLKPSFIINSSLKVLEMQTPLINLNVFTNIFSLYIEISYSDQKEIFITIGTKIFELVTDLNCMNLSIFENFALFSSAVHHTLGQGSFYCFSLFTYGLVDCRCKTVQKLFGLFLVLFLSLCKNRAHRHCSNIFSI